MAETILAAKDMTPRRVVDAEPEQLSPGASVERSSKAEKEKPDAPPRRAGTNASLPDLTLPAIPTMTPPGPVLLPPQASSPLFSKQPLLTGPHDDPIPVQVPVAASPFRNGPPLLAGTFQADARPVYVESHSELPAVPDGKADIVHPEPKVAAAATAASEVRESVLAVPTRESSTTVQVEAPSVAPAKNSMSADTTGQPAQPGEAALPTPAPLSPRPSPLASDGLLAALPTPSGTAPPPTAPLVELQAGTSSATPLRRAGRDSATPALGDHRGVPVAPQPAISFVEAGGQLRVPQGALHSESNLAASGGRGADFAGRMETFSAIDMQPGPGTPRWTHSGAQQAEAGFEDPALGWIGVRAGMSGGAVHASLIPGSASAADELGRHLDGLTTYLAEQHTPVGSLGVSAHQSRGTDADSRGGAGPGNSPDSQQGSGRHSQQDPQQDAGHTTQAPSNSRSESVAAIGGTGVDAASRLPGEMEAAGPALTRTGADAGHISVMA